METIKIIYYLIGISSFLNALELIAVLNPPILFQGKHFNVNNTIIIKTGLILQAFLSLFIIIFSYLNFSFYLTLSVWLLFFTYIFLYSKRHVGKDGADQMRFIIIGILALCSLLSKNFSNIIIIFFISIQAIISYSTSGMSKLFSQHWRKGDVLGKILNTYSYGNKPAANFLLKNKYINTFLTITPIVLMLLLPFCYAFSNPFFLELNLTGLLFFHFGTSILMGLNDFIYTFPVTYPALLSLHCIIYSY